MVDGPPEGLTEEDQEKLLKEKVLIRDQRDDKDVSVPYNVQAEKKLFNPTETGLYHVLVKPGDFEKCLVIVNPHGPHGRKQFCTVVASAWREELAQHACRPRSGPPASIEGPNTTSGTTG
jgi:hypothetical protein